MPASFIVFGALFHILILVASPTKVLRMIFVDPISYNLPLELSLVVLALISVDCLSIFGGYELWCVAFHILVSLMCAEIMLIKCIIFLTLLSDIDSTSQ